MRRDKRETVETITKLRSYGLSLRAIAERIGLRKSQVGRIVREFHVEQGTLCPHCGLATDRIPLENICGEARPKES